MQTLSKDTYFSVKNHFLTNSRINDFLKDKNYCYKKNITGEIENKKTGPMTIGSGVDCILTDCREAFDKKYVVVARRNLKLPPKDIIELTQAQFDEIIAISESVARQDAYKEIKNEGHIAQEILTMEMDLGKFCGLAGIPDWYKVNGQEAIITDLKTANQANSATKYFYHCLDYSYFRQAAMYSLLLKHKYPEIKNITCRHLVVETDVDGVNKVYTFILSEERINMEKEFILDIVLPAIKAETEFAPSNVKWSDSVVIGEINSEF